MRFRAGYKAGKFSQDGPVRIFSHPVHMFGSTQFMKNKHWNHPAECVLKGLPFEGTLSSLG